MFSLNFAMWPNFLTRCLRSVFGFGSEYSGPCPDLSLFSSCLLVFVGCLSNSCNCCIDVAACCCSGNWVILVVVQRVWTGVQQGLSPLVLVGSVCLACCCGMFFGDCCSGSWVILVVVESCWTGDRLGLA